MKQGDTLADLGEVGEDLFLVLGQDLRAHGNLDHEIVRTRACAVAAHAVSATAGFEMLCVTKIDQRVQPGDRHEHHIAALAAVTAVGAAILDILLTPETDGPRAAPAGLQIDFGLIEKMHCVAGKPN